MPDKNTPDSEWKEHLDAMEYKVLRQKGTSPRGGEYDGFYPRTQRRPLCMPWLRKTALQRRCQVQVWLRVASV